MPTDLVRLMHALFHPPTDPFQRSMWQPAVDVYRTSTGWLVKFELAGVRPGDVQLIIQGNQLTLRGERRDWCAEEGGRYYRLEIAYSQFERIVELPCELSESRITTDYQFGLLLVRIETETDK